MPYFPPEQETKAFFKNTSQEEKIVSDYTGIDFLRIKEIGIFSYWQYLHDAVIWNCNQSEEGRKYLENAYYFMQDKPDISGLIELMGERVVKNGK